MSDTATKPATQPETDPAETAAGNAPKEKPFEMELDRHGKKIVVPLDKARSLAMKGLDYEARSAKLKSDEEALKGDTTRYREYEKLRNAVDSNPRMRKALEHAITDPDSVLNALEGKRSTTKGSREEPEEDDEAEEKPKRSRSEPDSDVARELAEIKGKLTAREQREAVAERKSVIEGELESYPWLEGKQRGIALRDIANHLERHPGESVASVVAAVANEFREAEEERRAKQLERGKDKERLRTVDARRNTPITTTGPKLTKKSFDNGDLHRALVASARNAGLMD